MLAEGKLYWIQDAYTLSDRFPYSQPSRVSPTNLNYIRNAVKVVMDVYDGSVSFYVIDPADPIIGVYRRAFPGMFKDLSASLAPWLSGPIRIMAGGLFWVAASYRPHHEA